MKIAMMVRGYIPVPRPADIVYAPIDLAVAIANGLVEHGHSVDFFAPHNGRNESHLNPKFVTEDMGLRALVHNDEEFKELLTYTERLNHYYPGMWDWKMAEEMFHRADKGIYDLLYFHHPEVALPLTKIYPKVPIAMTLNDPLYPWLREMFGMYRATNQYFISISNNQRRDGPDVSYATTVYNGVDTEVFPFSAESEDYLLFVGRVVPEKGAKEAVQIAIESKQRLLIIGTVHPNNQEYFDQHIKPFLSDRILFLGFIEREQVAKYYQKAKALLMPIQWEEPFGLTMIEAMSCGTPVIALRRGSVSEVVAHKKTGFVVDSIAEMVESISHIGNISRQACRDHVVAHFSLDRMVDEYERAFKQIIVQHPRLGKKIVSRLNPTIPTNRKPKIKKTSKS